MATALGGRREPIEIPQTPPEIINVDELDIPVIPRMRHHDALEEPLSSRPSTRRRLPSLPQEVITLSDDDDDAIMNDDIDDEIIDLSHPDGRQRNSQQIRWRTRGKNSS